jgi:hypothetical protein
MNKLNNLQRAEIALRGMEMKLGTILPTAQSLAAGQAAYLDHCKAIKRAEQSHGLAAYPLRIMPDGERQFITGPDTFAIIGRDYTPRHFRTTSGGVFAIEK